MADVARVKADIKRRLMTEQWRQDNLDLVLVAGVFDALTGADGVKVVEGFRRRLDEDVGKFLREKVEAALSAKADTQVDAATADGVLTLNEYEKLI